MSVGLIVSDRQEEMKLLVDILTILNFSRKFLLQPLTSNGTWCMMVSDAVQMYSLRYLAYQLLWRVPTRVPPFLRAMLPEQV